MEGYYFLLVFKRGTLIRVHLIDLVSIEKKSSLVYLIIKRKSFIFIKNNNNKMEEKRRMAWKRYLEILMEKLKGNGSK